MAQKPLLHFNLALALLLTAGMAASCADDLPAPTDTASTQAITFDTPQTRAAKDDFNNGDKFSVWAWRDGTQIFEKEEVSYDGATWSYDGVEYWFENQTYNFYAVYPAGLQNVTVNKTGDITITGFDCTTGTDLMTAKKENVQYEPIENTPAAPVAFQFEHLLAKVRIMGRAENGTATVNSLTLSGLHKTGDYSSASGWTNGKTGDDFSGIANTKLGANAVIVLEQLMIPQGMTGNIRISVIYTLDGAIARQNATYTLPSDMVNQWEAGKSYQYTFTVMGNRIVFDKPTVQAWDDATGGIIVVE